MLITKTKTLHQPQEIKTFQLWTVIVKKYVENIQIGIGVKIPKKTTQWSWCKHTAAWLLSVQFYPLFSGSMKILLVNQFYNDHHGFMTSCLAIPDMVEGRHGFNPFNTRDTRMADSWRYQRENTDSNVEKISLSYQLCTDMQHITNVKCCMSAQSCFSRLPNLLEFHQLCKTDERLR